MSEVRCPMCSKKNPADAEACEFCGARIKPLIIQQPPEEIPSKVEIIPSSPLGQPKDQPQEQGPTEENLPQDDWLSQMRFGMEGEQEEEPSFTEEEAELKQGETDLLGRFRELGISGESIEPPIDEESVRQEPPLKKESVPDVDLNFPSREAQNHIEPLVHDVEFPDQSAGSGIKREEKKAPVPDWLARIRAREEQEEVETPQQTETTDWLSGLRQDSFDVDEDKGEPFGLPEEPLEPDELLESEDTLQPLILETPEEQQILSSDIEDSSVSAKDSLDDLFYELDLLADAEDEGVPGVAEPSSPDFETISPEKDEMDDLENLFQELELSASKEVEGLKDDELFPTADITPSKEAGGIFSDDFFAGLEAMYEDDHAEVEEDRLGGLPQGLDAATGPLIDANFFTDLGIEIDEGITKVEGEKSKPAILEPTEEVGQPEMEFEEDLLPRSTGIQDLAPGSDLLAKESFLEEFESEEISSSLTESLQETPSERASLRDLLGDFRPSWMDDTISDSGGGLPHIPALILDDEMPPLELSAGEGGLPSLEIPNWLQDLGRDVEDEIIDDGAELPALAKAILPPWLEAMRPIETFRQRPEIELDLEEEEGVLEAAGPLAGLKGVLSAEPIVAMPRTPIATLGGLDISDHDLSQVDLLESLVEEEQGEEVGLGTKKRKVPILRWVCSASLLLAVTIPSVLGFPQFKTPFDLEHPRQPAELKITRDVIDSIPQDHPVLLVFDYDPSYSAEMDAVAGALVVNLFSREQPVVSLSTQPSGPLLADRMFRRFGEVHNRVNGEDYLQLGYLSGGTAALQLFATSPQDALSRGFSLPEGFEGESIWELPLIADIHHISDFAMVAVITSGTETARNWAEQVHPLLESTPLIMVVSAGVEPLIHPYFEAEDPQVDGILSGLPSAIIYEGINGFQADAFLRWNSYGTGALIAMLILIVGAGYGVISWVMERLHLSRS